MMIVSKTLKIGDTVLTERFGLQKITGIDLCEEVNGKYGIAVKEIYTDLVDRCVFDFAAVNGWQYGHQIDFVNV